MSLPHSAEAEQSLVARLMLEPEQMGTIDLDAEDMYVQAYREQYAAIKAAVEAGKPVDVLTIGNDLGEPVDVLALGEGHTASLSAYVEIIRAKAYQRKMIAMGRELIEAASEGYTDRIIEVASQAVELSVSAPHDNGLGLVNLADHKAPPPPPLLGALSPEGTTVLYGDGGDGKGWVAAKWASQLDTRIAILDFENHPNEWAYRLDKFGMENAIYMTPPNTMEKWADGRAARLLRDEGVGFLIIDSAMYASNIEDPYSPASAIAYKRARSRLGNLPAILLAHTTGGVDKVFGSVFWRNEARVIWRLNKDSNGRRYLECRKANNYSALEGTRFNIEFNEERGILNLHPHGQAWTPAVTPLGEEAVARDWSREEDLDW